MTNNNTDELYNLYKRRYLDSVARSEATALSTLERTQGGVRDYMRSATEQAAARERGKVTDAIPQYAQTAYQAYLDQQTAGKSGFTYSPDTDPTYQAYQRQAEREADTTYRNALAQYSARTGGIASSQAAQVAARAAAEAAQGANTVLANLYKNAYNKYASGYKDPDYSTPLSETGGTATPTVPTAQQTLPGVLPSSTMQAGDVPGYNRPAESAYIPAETITADPREQHRPPVEPSTYVDPEAGSSAGTYTVENGVLYYGDGEGNIYTFDDGTPIEVQYDEDGNKLSLEDAVAAVNERNEAAAQTASEDEELEEAEMTVRIGEELEAQFKDLPSDKVYEYVNSEIETINAIDEEMEEIEQKASGLDRNSGEFAELAGRYQELYDQRNEEYTRYTESLSIARQKEGQERVQMLRDLAGETGGVITDPEDWKIITENFSEREIAQAGLRYHENIYKEAYDSLTEDERVEIATEVADDFSDMTWNQILNSSEYKRLSAAEESGKATARDIFKFEQLKQTASQKIESENRTANKDRELEELKDEVVNAIYEEYEDGAVTSSKVWEQLVKWYGYDQLYSRGITMK